MALRRLRTVAPTPAKPVPSKSIVVGSGTEDVGGGGTPGDPVAKVKETFDLAPWRIAS
jgi:hypothetical protein